MDVKQKFLESEKVGFVPRSSIASSSDAPENPTNVRIKTIINEEKQPERQQVSGIEFQYFRMYHWVRSGFSGADCCKSPGTLLCSVILSQRDDGIVKGGGQFRLGESVSKLILTSTKP